MTDDCIGSGTYLQACFMRPEVATRVAGMVASRVDLSGIDVKISPSDGAYTDIQSRHTPKEEVLVIFKIPCGGISMPTFYGEMCKSINEKAFEIVSEPECKVEIKPRQSVNIPFGLTLRKALFG